MAEKLLENKPSKLNRSGRPQRVPIHGLRNALDVLGQEPGWHYCWVNEHNVDRYTNGGYDFVEHEVTVGDRKIDAASQVGGRISKAVGLNLAGYLMRCPEEIYKEEMAYVDAETDERTAGIHSKEREPGFYGKIEMGMSKPLGK
jgi:hypothetical protein